MVVSDTKVGAWVDSNVGGLVCGSAGCSSGEDLNVGYYTWVNAIAGPNKGLTRLAMGKSLQ